MIPSTTFSFFHFLADFDWHINLPKLVHFFVSFQEKPIRTSQSVLDTIRGIAYISLSFAFSLLSFPFIFIFYFFFTFSRGQQAFHNFISAQEIPTLYLVPIKRRMWDLFILFGRSIGWMVLRARAKDWGVLLFYLFYFLYAWIWGFSFLFF